jgi:serine/threonine-protein kinase SRPK3
MEPTSVWFFSLLDRVYHHGYGCDWKRILKGYYGNSPTKLHRHWTSCTRTTSVTEVSSLGINIGVGFSSYTNTHSQDFRPSNILVKLANIDHLSEHELLSQIGQPLQIAVQTESGEEIPSSCPKYLVQSADISRLGNEFLTDEICVIDFGESYKFSSPPGYLGIPENYLPPEVLLVLPDAIGPACDLWVLACTLFEIREQLPLFYMIYDNDELLAEMVRFFGKLPDDWWAKWEARKDYFDHDGKWLREEEDWSLEVALSKPMEIFDSGDKYDEGPVKSLQTSEGEQKLLADLLYQLFQYDPHKRISAEEVLRHGWFKLQ